jgi:hypothetical protein
MGSRATTARQRRSPAGPTSGLSGQAPAVRFPPRPPRLLASSLEVGRRTKSGREADSTPKRVLAPPHTRGEERRDPRGVRVPYEEVCYLQGCAKKREELRARLKPFEVGVPLCDSKRRMDSESVVQQGERHFDEDAALPWGTPKVASRREAPLPRPSIPGIRPEVNAASLGHTRPGTRTHQPCDPLSAIHKPRKRWSRHPGYPTPQKPDEPDRVSRGPGLLGHAVASSERNRFLLGVLLLVFEGWDVAE